MKPNKLGWRKDPWDPRDCLHELGVAKIADIVITPSALLPTVRDQGNVGSCVGHGIGGNVTARAIALGDYTEWYSPTWIYNGARYIEGTLTQDNGCYPRDALKWLLKQGCLLEHLWPYDPKKLDQRPPPSSLYSTAAQHPLIAYYRVTNGTTGICSALSAGFIVSIGTPWFQKWMAGTGPSNTKSPGLLPKASLVDPARWGVIVILSSLSISSFAGMGSWSKTSIAAPVMRLSLSAATRAAWSTRPERAVFTRMAVLFMNASWGSPMRPWVSSE